MKITVKDRQVDHANKTLKRRMQKAGLFDYLQNHKHHITKTQVRKERKANCAKVIAKYLRIRMKKEGY